MEEQNKILLDKLIKDYSIQDNPSITQGIASNPTSSVWLSASAGTGKTKVLIDRLLRLLLNGVYFNKILCITYTKAAAIEITNRIADKLKVWAVCENNDLKDQLNKLINYDENLEKQNIDDKLLRKARGLFTEYLDAPGGLKVQTIHSFCESILKKFPIEAGVSPHFTLIEDREINEVLEDAYLSILQDGRYAENQNDIDIGKTFDILTNHISEHSFDGLKKSLIDDRSKFAKLFNKYNSIEKIKSHYKDLYLKGVNENTVEEYLSSALKDDKCDAQNLRSICDSLINDAKSGKSDLRVGNGIAKFFQILDSDIEKRINSFKEYQGVYLKKDHEIQKTLLTATIKKIYPTSEQIINDEAERVYKIQATIDNFAFYEYSVAVCSFAFLLIKKYQDYKIKSSVLDFEDLIHKVEELFKKEDIAPWILYKMDGGIDHILIDEAQDTSSLQWDIVKALTDEYFTDGASKDDVKTIFVVGDRKQSIFSFQGANIQSFEDNKNYYEEKILSSGYDWQPLTMEVSFRTSLPVLMLVNEVLKNDIGRQGVLLEEEISKHISFRFNQKDFGGQVHLLPLVKYNKEAKNALKEESDSWVVPKVKDSFTNEKQKLAKVISTKIKELISGSDTVVDKETGKEKNIDPSDIMVLVRRRANFTEALTKELLKQNIPVVGIDRLNLSENIIVQDFTSGLEFCLSNYNDLALAEFLKSPFIGLGEDDLFKLARNNDDITKLRSNSLFKNIKNFKEYKETYDYLNNLIEVSQKVSTPFEFFSYMLNQNNSKEKIFTRFGMDIKDVIDEFLSLCISYEKSKSHITGLSGFLKWFGSTDSIIKRDMEQVQNAVRIMTVFGSKGLEAPIVFLPDTVDENFGKGGGISPTLWDGNFTPFFSIPNFDDIKSNYYTDIKDSEKLKNENEYRRLLYVALTRPRDRLYVGGYETSKKKNYTKDGEKKTTWYSLIKSSFNNLKDTGFVTEYNDTNINKYGYFKDEDKSLIFSLGQNKNSVQTNDIDKHVESYVFNKENYSWLNDKVVSKKITDISDFKTSKDIDSKALLKGTIVHKLFELILSVKEDKRESKIENFLNNYKDSFLPEELNQIQSSILNIINNKEYSKFFSDKSKFEVELIAKENGKNKIYRVDNISFSEDEKTIYILDYKTDIDTSQVPNSYKKQLNNYKKLVSNVYPNKEIICAILWINDATITYI